MGLWGKTDLVASAPKFLNLSNYPAGTRLVLVDANEAALLDNKSRGLSSPGWWLYYSFTDNNSQVRYKTEQLVSFSSAVTTVSAGDNNTDDNILKDLLIIFTTQPVNASVATGATATFTAVTNPSSGVTYQWQESIGVAAFTNVSNGGGFTGATTASLAIVTTLPMNGRRYRLVATKTAGDAPVATSNIVTLTVA